MRLLPLRSARPLRFTPSSAAILVVLGAPSAFSAQWVRHPGPGGGEVRVLATSSSRPGMVLCGSGHPGYRNGSFRSDDGGRTWVQNTRAPATFRGLDFAFHPTDPDVFHQVEDDFLYRTEDGGLTWERYFLPGDYLCCYAQIEFDPAQAGRVYAIALDIFDPLLFRSDDDGRTWQPSGSARTGETTGIPEDPS